MCGRIALSELSWRQFAALLAAEVIDSPGVTVHDRYNIAPAQRHWIARQRAGRTELLPASWGFTGPKGLLINARSETVDRLPTFRGAFEERRCVVPADGFYEWQGGKRGARQPSWFHPKEGPLMMAGLYREGKEGLAFVILTTAASPPVREIHDRMPAILSREAALGWLRSPDLALLQPAREGVLERRRVGLRVNSAAVDDPECLAPFTEEPERQLKLL